MFKDTARLYFMELVATFGLVYFSAAVVCINHVTTPKKETAIPFEQTTAEPQLPGRDPILVHQPGLVGVALAHGLILGVLLTLTVPAGGGYLNPAITLMLWVTNRMDTGKALAFGAAQFLGALLAGLFIYWTFTKQVLQNALLGGPHVNVLPFEFLNQRTWVTGTGVELFLTFFLVWAIFAAAGSGEPGWSGRVGLAAGAVMTAAVLVAFPLTGAAANPARWFGTAFWEWTMSRTESAMKNPLGDFVVFICGPILGALLGGIFYLTVYVPRLKEAAASPPETSLLGKGKN